MNNQQTSRPQGAYAGKLARETIRPGTLATARCARFGAGPELARCPSDRRPADRCALRSPRALSVGDGPSGYRRPGIHWRTRRNLVDPDTLRRLRRALRPWIEKPPRSLYVGRCQSACTGLGTWNGRAVDPLPHDLERGRCGVLRARSDPTPVCSRVDSFARLRRLGLMESFDFLAKTVVRACKHADVPSPDVAGASDGDGWIWRWELPRQTTDQYRGDLTLLFKARHLWRAPPPPADRERPFTEDFGRLDSELSSGPPLGARDPSSQGGRPEV